MRIPEILSPAGDQERLEAAVRYGADAVYLGGDRFGMRASSANFGGEALERAVSYAHDRGVRVYLTCNTLPTNQEIPQLPEFLRQAQNAGVDALIVADVGILALAKELVPQLPIHISTQAGVVNYLTANQLYKLGASRVVLARELSLEEIRQIREQTSPELELEVFVHGSMCMSFSGRCLLSHYMTGRDANRGECAQPCRWKYHLVEEKRPGQYFPIQEEDYGSYILNAKDLSMLPYLDQLVKAGVASLKIEGRAKSAYYTAAVTNAYRGAMDAYQASPDTFQPPMWALEELEKVSHRPYSTGFFFGVPDQCCETGGYIREWDVIAVVEGWENGNLLVSERNKFLKGDQAEAMMPGAPPIPIEIREIIDPEEGPVESARHPMRLYQIPWETPLPVGIMLRRQV